MTKTKAARNSGNCSRANVPQRFTDTAILQDIALGVFGALLMLGVPFVMALLKQLGAW